MKRMDSAFVAKTLLIFSTIFEIIVLVYFNFFNIHAAVDQDYAQLLFHAMQMADKNKILLDNWYYSTTGEFDCPMLLAALFYKICGNIYYAYAISNLVNIVVWIFALYTLMENAGVSTYGKAVAACLVFTTYDFSILYYTNMMFIRGSQYTIKVLLPIMFIAVLSCSENERKSIKNIILLILFYFLSFLTAFSSGIYVFLCGFFPVIICTLVYYVFDKNFKDKKYYYVNILGTIAATVFGIFFGKLSDFTVKSDNFMIRNDVDIIDALGNSIGDLFWAFRLFPDYPVSVNSVEAIGIVVRWCVIALICFGFFSITKAFALKRYGRYDSEQSTRDFVSTSLISVFVFTILLLTLIPSRIRYQLIGAIPLMLVATINIEDWANKMQIIYKYVFYALCGMIFFANSIFSISFDAKQWLNGEKSEYQIDYDLNAKIKRVLDENEVEIAYVLNHSQFRAGLTLSDCDRRYAFIDSDGQIGAGWDNYTKTGRSNNPDFGKRNAIIYTQSKGDRPEFINNYSLIANIDEYEIYFSDENYLENNE